MTPFAESFMVYSGDEPAPTLAPTAQEVYGDLLGGITQTEYTTLADCPDTVLGYPAKPTWLPERFAYLQGSMYADTLVTSITHIFTSDAGSCILDISVVTNTNDIDSYQFEQVPDDKLATYVGGYQVVFYRNSDQATLTASWMVENAHYCITGSVSEDEILQILESIMK